VRNAQGVDFLLGTGFSDLQRDSPPAIGALVSYTHRGHTADGVPRFASFLRVRSEHF
jgi:DNA ligase-1